MPTRKFITVSLSPLLLRQAETVAREENRTKPALVREALRLYLGTRKLRKQPARERFLMMIKEIQARVKRTPPSEVRKVIREAVAVVRSEGRRSIT